MRLAKFVMRSGAVCAMCAVLGLGPIAVAQSGRNGETPPHWQVLADDGSRDSRTFEVMRPGWHVFAGPAAILWDPGSYASGNFSASGKMFLFAAGDGGSSSTTTDEPYGVFLGGRNLGEADATYVTFLLRNDGRFTVAHHAGGEAHTLVPWTEHEAVATLSPGGDSTVENVLAVDATDELVVFFVNDQEVARIARGELRPGGTIGLRAGEGLSLHVTELAIGPNRRRP